MTVPIGNYYIFVFIINSQTLVHIESSSARYFSFVGDSQLSRVEFQRHIFWILEFAGKKRDMSIGCGFECCLHLLKADRLAAVIITTAGVPVVFTF